MGLFIRCQLCKKESVWCPNQFYEPLCEWCRSFVSQKRQEGLKTVGEIEKAYKKHVEKNLSSP